ncbi:MAG: lytic transglycosylase domain-containing protein [Myxococcota bacterium]
MSATATAVWLSATVFIQAPTQDDVIQHLLDRTRRWSSSQVDSIGTVVFERATALDLDPELVVAVMAVESDFRAGARSKAGALGLMQIMPSTGRVFANRAGVDWRGPDTLYEPVANIRIGTQYIRWLLDRFRGNQALALTAYCHGIGTVRRRLRTQDGLSHRTLRYSRKVQRRLEGLRRIRAQRPELYPATYAQPPISRRRRFRAGL